MSKYVYSFGGGTADGDGKMKDTLGGKGAGLAEMSRAGVPVPPGFTISTDVCNIYFDNNKQGSGRSRRADLGSARRSSKKRMRQEAGRRRRPAAAQRALRREVLHARHDEHHPQPRPERRDRRRPGGEDRQSALRVRLLPPLHPDVRRSRARHRHGDVRRDLRRAQAQGQGQARYRPHRRRPEGDHRRLQEARARRRPASRFPQDAARAAHARRATPCSAPGGTPKAIVLPQDGKDSRRPRHRRQRAGHGVRQHGRQLLHRRRLHARPRHAARRSSTASSW